MKIFKIECSCSKKVVIHPAADIKSVFSLYSGLSHSSPNSRYFGMSYGGMVIRLPNGRFQLTAYWLSMKSSIVGPVGKASRPRPLMATLPTEVVTVSI